jgi:hypothetical protein
MRSSDLRVFVLIGFTAVIAACQDPLRRASGLRLLGVSLRKDGRAKDAVEPLLTAFALSQGAEDALLSGEILYE